MALWDIDKKTAVLVAHLFIGTFIVLVVALMVLLRTFWTKLALRRRRDMALASAPILLNIGACLFMSIDSHSMAIRLAMLGPAAYGTAIILTCVVNRTTFLVKSVRAQLARVAAATLAFLFGYMLYCSLDLVDAADSSWFLLSSVTFFSMSSICVMRLLYLLDVWEEASNLTPGELCQHICALPSLNQFSEDTLKVERAPITEQMSYLACYTGMYWAVFICHAVVASYYGRTLSPLWRCIAMNANVVFADMMTILHRKGAFYKSRHAVGLRILTIITFRVIVLTTYSLDWFGCICFCFVFLASWMVFVCLDKHIPNSGTSSTLGMDDDVWESLCVNHLSSLMADKDKKEGEAPGPFAHSPPAGTTLYAAVRAARKLTCDPEVWRHQRQVVHHSSRGRASYLSKLLPWWVQTPEFFLVAFTLLFLCSSSPSRRQIMSSWTTPFLGTVR